MKNIFVEDVMNPILVRYNSRLPFSVQERDIDLLLVEQLHVNRAFADWLTGRLNLTGAVIETVQHSVYKEHGETDVLVTFKCGEERVAVMIEDKIAAAMQPDQCERYHRRGKRLCEDGKVHRYVAVLCAPAGYLNGVLHDQLWHHRISLEEIAQIIELAAYPGWEWRHAILVAAASRLTRAREADKTANKAYDAAIVLLKKPYFDFVQSRYPQLKKTTFKENSEREYYIKAVELPAGIRFKHAFFRGEVSLIFEKKWARIAERELQGNLPKGASTVPHGSEVHVRMPVEIMDPQLPFNEQIEIVTKALDQVCGMIGLAQSVAKAGL